jgi:hypothetical protein
VTAVIVCLITPVGAFDLGLPEDYPTPPCYCACALAHPEAPGICIPDALTAVRHIAGVPVPLCGPCAAALDSRPPREWR